MHTDLKQSIGFNINKTANLLNSSFNHKLKQHSIALEQRATLEILEFEENVTQTKIAEILGKDKTTISRTLKTLEKKGFIKKEELDKRTYLIKLTKLGENVLKESTQTVQDFRASVASKLSQDEIDQFFSTLEKVLISLNEQK
ncbi:MarR family winged helix-turn-helix transcriptional regulator [Poseidonibacter antarcticus]|uniref:MarR family winged helix-turn-helix transcriptional regulator n=1 Tax=Poseidonibacter antarcticus TaxID=2478538 RepID=UPI000EF44DE0|nr:MarR family transcriptional regulator [Poseidonibacter antarcticus]